MGIFGELDHWYHLFVFIYYHTFSKIQYGMLYKMHSFVLNKTQKMVIICKYLVDISEVL